MIVNTNENIKPLIEEAGFQSCWIKRGDFHAMHKEDVSYVRHADEAQEVLQEYFYRGITRAVINVHLVGDLVKFYGIRGSQFFFWFYPFDQGHSKYGWEKVNGGRRRLAANHRLQRLAQLRPLPRPSCATHSQKRAQHHQEQALTFHHPTHE